MNDATPTGADVDVQGEILSILNKPSKPSATPEPTGTQSESEDVTAAEQEPAAESDPQDAPKDDQGPQYELSHIAAILGVDDAILDVSEDGKVILKAKVDGRESAVKAADLLKSYQLEGHLNNKNMEVAEVKKALEAERQQFHAEAMAQAQQLQQALTIANAELNADFSGVDWQSLEATNPQEFLKLRLKFQDRQNRLAAAQQFLDAKRQESVQSRLLDERTKLLEKIPEWRNQQAFESARQEMLSGLNVYGFTPEEVGSALDHRLLVLARDALAYRKLQAAKPETTKKVAAAPKIVRPGTTAAPVSGAAKIAEMRKQVKASGEGVAEFLKASGIAKARR